MLAQISDELEAVKSEMEERGSSMTDGTPLVNIRKTLGRLKQEIINMDVRIGVVEHTLLQAKLKDKSNMQKDMHSLHLQNEENNYYMWKNLEIKNLLDLTLLKISFLLLDMA